ncbi:uncharacterized protein LOC135205778 [Macrobrachium nipponense]|uniref:uncharacterized protein LOC135205778 n=1 Tax=Macrobrachium nipponense TaxID=159736 RepID=UPI0030C883B1
MPGGHTSRDNIIRIIECYKVGLSSSEISAQVNVQKRTVCNIIAKYKAGGEKEIPVHKHGGGVPKKQSPRALRFIKNKLEANPILTAKQLKENYPKVLGETSVRTLQKRISGDLGFKKVKAKKKPLITEKQRKARVVFCKKVREWPLERVRKILFTDKATFYISDPAGQKVWVKKGGDPSHPKATAKTVKYPASLMVWGAFGYGGVADLVVLPKGQTVNANVYYEILNLYLPDAFEKTGTEILQQDGAPCHTAKIIKQWLGDCDVKYINDWPGNSPDLSPIENLWAIIKAQLRNKDTSTVPKLEEALKECWAALDPQICRILIDSIPNRVTEVIKRKGLPANTRRLIDAGDFELEPDHDEQDEEEDEEDPDAPDPDSAHENEPILELEPEREFEPEPEHRSEPESRAKSTSPPRKDEPSQKGMSSYSSPHKDDDSSEEKDFDLSHRQHSRDNTTAKGDDIAVKEEVEDEYYKTGYEDAPMQDMSVKEELGNGYEGSMKIEEIDVKEELLEPKQELSDTEDRRGEKRRAHSQSRSPDSKKQRPEVEEVRVEDEPEFDKSAVLLDCYFSMAKKNLGEEEYSELLFVSSDEEEPSTVSPVLPSASPAVTAAVSVPDISPVEIRSRKRRRGPLCLAEGVALKRLPDDSYKARDNTKWHSEPNPTMPPILEIDQFDTAGPTMAVFGCRTPAEVFDKFLPNTLLAEVIVHTNDKIFTLRNKFKRQNDPTFKDLSLMELRAFLGILIMTGARKDNHLTSEEMFSKSLGCPFYRSVMSERRFAFIQRALRFDSLATREERVKTDKFAPIRSLWNQVIANCIANYEPSGQLTVDEQLLGFRGRCGFRMYIPNKPAKYGIKLVMACDAKTFYMCNAIPYLARGLPLQVRPWESTLRWR